MSDILSEQQKKYGQRKHLLFAIFNGFSIALVAEGTMILYALKIGIPDYIIGVMSSFIFLGMPFIFLGKKIVEKIGVSKTVAAAWFLRSISTLIAAAAPVVIYYSSSLYLGFAFVLLGAFGFYVFRGIGSIGWTPILGEITSENDREKYSSKLFLYFNIAYFISILSLIVTLEFWDSIGTFQLVIVLGCVLGFFSAYNVFLVPESNTPKRSASVPLREAMNFIFKYPEGRKLIWIQTIYFIGVTLTVPYSMLALKEGYNIRDYKAMSFMLIQLIGGIVISLIFKKLIDQVGPKKLIIGLFFLMITASAMWIVAPAEFIPWYNAIIFFFIGIAQMGGFLALMMYFLNIIPSIKRVGSTLIITIVSSFSAGFFGAVIGAGMLKLLKSYHLESLNLFHWFFGIVLLMLICGIFIILRLEKNNI
jgi:MFS family permease